MLSHVEFVSNAFPIEQSEKELLSDGQFGLSLANFLFNSLTTQGIPAEQPESEDWGWRIPILNTEFPLWIGVGNYEEYPNGFLCFIEPSVPSLRQFPFFWKKISTESAVSRIQHAINDALGSRDDIENILWRTIDEFHESDS